jgi:hypothetical protein
MRPRIGRGFLQIELTEELYMRSCTAKKLSVILSRCWIEFERAKLLPESVQLVHLVLVHKHRFGEHLYQGNLALGWGGRGGREGESNVGPDLAVETLLLQRPTQRFESTPRPLLLTGRAYVLREIAHFRDSGRRRRLVIESAPPIGQGSDLFWPGDEPDLFRQCLRQCQGQFTLSHRRSRLVTKDQWCKSTYTEHHPLAQRTTEEV